MSRNKLKKDIKTFISCIIDGECDGIKIINGALKDCKSITLYSKGINIEINGYKSPEEMAYFILAQLIIHTKALEVAAFKMDLVLFTPNNSIGSITDVYKYITGGKIPDMGIISSIVNFTSKKLKEINYEKAKEIIDRIGYKLPSIELEEIGVIIAHGDNYPFIIPVEWEDYYD